MVVALEGWVDAGMGASAAIAELLAASPTTAVASFDTESLIDQRARRPIARLEDGVTTELTWPAIRIVAGKDRVGADILYLTGPEPDFRWPTFIDAVVGTGPGPQRPHRGRSRRLSRHPPRTPDRCDWPRPSLPSRWSWPDGWGPCTALSRCPPACRPRSRWHLGEAGVPVIGLWARVPHYVSAMPYPEASAALIEGLCAVTGTVLDSSSLRDAAEASRRQVDELIGANPEHLEMVRRLEAALDSEEVPPVVLDVDVPSGDEIAAELEQFLRGEGH